MKNKVRQKKEVTICLRRPDEWTLISFGFTFVRITLERNRKKEGDELNNFYLTT